MKAKTKKIIQRFCACILSAAILVCSTYQENLLAENISSNYEVEPLSAAFQTQHLQVNVENHPLNGKYDYEEVVLIDYTDAIIENLYGEDTIIESIDSKEGFYKFETKR